MKIAVVYWTGTGNTQMMAEAIADALDDLSLDYLFEFVNDIQVDEVKDYDLFFLGCPAMTGEEIEELEFRPFFEDLGPNLKGKKIILFGSYDWGGGLWMESWKDEVLEYGGEIMDTMIQQWNPEDEDLEKIKERVIEKLS